MAPVLVEDIDYLLANVRPNDGVQFFKLIARRIGEYNLPQHAPEPQHSATVKLRMVEQKE